jgi:hypothetical protein
MSDTIGALGEFFRRSGRNLAQVPGDVAGYAGDFMTNTKNAAVGMAEPSMRIMRGEGLENPLFPSVESGGQSRLGDVASALNPDMLPGNVPGSLGTWGGPLGQTGKQRNLKFAQKAAREGKLSNDEIFEKYGWTQQPVTGDWRYEIPDNTAKLVPTPDPNLSAQEFGLKYPKGYEYVHRELMKAYPHLKNMRIVTHDIGDHQALAFFDRQNTISLRSDLSPADALDSVVHEFQHPIQRFEGGSPGTSPNSPEIQGIAKEKMETARVQAEAVSRRFNEALNDYWNAQPRPQTMRDAALIRSRFLRENKELANQYEVAQETLNQLKDPYQVFMLRHGLYERSLGETEARDAQFRRTLTPEQRKAITPYYLGMVRADMPIRNPDELFDIREHLTNPAPKAPENPELRRMIRQHLGIPE